MLKQKVYFPCEGERRIEITQISMCSPSGKSNNSQGQTLMPNNDSSQGNDHNLDIQKTLLHVFNACASKYGSSHLTDRYAMICQITKCLYFTCNLACSSVWLKFPVIHARNLPLEYRYISENPLSFIVIRGERGR